MFEKVEKPKENKNRSAANSSALKADNVKQTFEFVDNRHEVVIQRKTMDLMTSGNKNISQANSQSMTSNRTEPEGNGWNQNSIVQRKVIGGEGNYYSDLDASKTIYETYQEAFHVDEVLFFLKSIIESIENGVGRMNAYDRARVARVKRDHEPSWIPDIARQNQAVGAMFVALLEKKEEKEIQWVQVGTDPKKCNEALAQEGYSAARDVYDSYLQTTGGKQAGYKQQLLEHMKEMIKWELEKIEPHYISSQGDTNTRADSLLITGATQEPQSQYYPPGSEFHQAVLVDHKLGYRTEQMAQNLAPSVKHAARGLPVEYHGKVLPTTTEFRFPFGASEHAVKVITETGKKEREDRPSAFSSGLKINATSVLNDADKDEMLKRLCGCVGLNNQQVVKKIHRVVNSYMFEEGVLTQVGRQLELFNSLSEWFKDLSDDVRAWLEPNEIYKLVKMDKSE